jgi:hypothetical protein
MSRPGFAYDGYRWENGWPAERTGETETSRAADEAGMARVPSNTDTNFTEGTMDTAQVVSIQAHNDYTHQASESAGSTAGYSQVSEAEEESEDDEHCEPGQVSLGSAYAQCKAAWRPPTAELLLTSPVMKTQWSVQLLVGTGLGLWTRGLTRALKTVSKGPELRKMVCWSTSTCHVRLILPPLFALHAKTSTSFWKGGRELSVTA